ncbi:seipin-like isoform X1 [Solea senegalensis]|uniref:Seipin n=2 Tax=Solea senegalensis TaxID=28829 RepID=A0AAV6SPR4_SOLSE|nr:seipin-like isoform X1 [Solea senegalensis]KAG7518975.1 seipin-like isoform X1 [Solea senegalensis]
MYTEENSSCRRQVLDWTISSLSLGFSDIMDQNSPLSSGAEEQQSVLRLRDVVITSMSNARRKATQGFVVFFAVVLLLCLASFLYGSFYFSYMPTAAFSTPVHYYYRTDCESSAPFLCSYPLANISLMRNRKHVLTFGQAYQISLQLEMPESPANQELGMFMIRVTCFSKDGGHVTSSARSVKPVSSARFSMLRYRSGLLRTVGTLLFLPAFLTGAIEQKQVLEVELFSDYMDDPYDPAATAVIEILSNKVQIYSSQLYVHAHFTGIRYWMFYFPVTSALVGVSSNFIFLSVLFIVSYMRLQMSVKPEQLRTDGPVSERENNMDNNQQEDNVAADPAELAGPHQTTPTNVSRRRPHLHFGDSTVRQNRVRFGQAETNGL